MKNTVWNGVDRNRRWEREKKLLVVDHYTEPTELVMRLDTRRTPEPAVGEEWWEIEMLSQERIEKRMPHSMRRQISPSALKHIDGTGQNKPAC